MKPYPASLLSAFRPGTGPPRLPASFLPLVLMMLVIALPCGLRADVPPPTISQFQTKPDGAVTLTWAAAPETAYRVLTSTNLADGIWTPIDSITASGSTVSWSANGQDGTARFFKLSTDAITIGSVE